MYRVCQRVYVILSYEDKLKYSHSLFIYTAASTDMCPQRQLIKALINSYICFQPHYSVINHVLNVYIGLIKAKLGHTK